MANMINIYTFTCKNMYRCSFNKYLHIGIIWSNQLYLNKILVSDLRLVLLDAFS